jgi:hypothetical protein
MGDLQRDEEAFALVCCWTALKPLDCESAKRVLSYVANRISEEGELSRVKPAKRKLIEDMEDFDKRLAAAEIEAADPNPIPEAFGD